MIRYTCSFVSVALLWACSAPQEKPVDITQVAKTCMKRANAAKAPTGSVTFGGNSQGGLFSKVRLDVSSSLLLGEDPENVYAQCWVEHTGEPPEIAYLP